VTMSSHLVGAVILGTCAGALARLDTLIVDYRQYPSYPQGYTIHMTLAVIAAFLGAVAIPALAVKASPRPASSPWPPRSFARCAPSSGRPC